MGKIISTTLALIFMFTALVFGIQSPTLSNKRASSTWTRNTNQVASSNWTKNAVASSTWTRHLV